jgi:hypothetical protein
MAAPGGAPGRPLPAYPSQYWEASALQLCRPGYLRITNIDGTQQAIPVEDLEGLAAQARSTVNQLFADIRAAFGPADDEQPTAGGGTSTPAPETTPNEGEGQVAFVAACFHASFVVVVLL